MLVSVIYLFFWVLVWSYSLLIEAYFVVFRLRSPVHMLLPFLRIISLCNNNCYYFKLKLKNEEDHLPAQVTLADYYMNQVNLYKKKLKMDG